MVISRPEPNLIEERIVHGFNNWYRLAADCHQIMELRINPVTAHLFMEKRTGRGRIIRPLFRRLASQVSISVYNAQSVAVVIKSHEGEKMAHRALEGTNY